MDRDDIIMIINVVQALVILLQQDADMLQHCLQLISTCMVHIHNQNKYRHEFYLNMQNTIVNKSK